MPPGLAGFFGVVVLLLPRPAAILDADRVEFLGEAVALDREAEAEEGEEVEEVLLIVVGCWRVLGWCWSWCWGGRGAFNEGLVWC